ncbi:MAG: helix-turn-helix domain-containing protein [Pseudomonadota bacterium]
MSSTMLDVIAKQRTLGADIRALRKARGKTLTQLASAMGRSVGWLSQVERDLSNPAIADLGKMAEILDVSVSSLVQTGAVPGEEGIVVRADARRPMGSRTPGLTEGLLSPDLTDDFEMIHSHYAPGARLAAPLRRPTQEVGYVIKGRIDFIMDGQTLRLRPGDSIRLRGQEFLWANNSGKECEMIWAISPPVY